MLLIYFQAACGPGQQPNTDGSASCEPCPLGTYKTEETDAGDGWRDSCTTCPVYNPHTLETGSTSKAMCMGRFNSIEWLFQNTN